MAGHGGTHTRAEKGIGGRKVNRACRGVVRCPWTKDRMAATIIGVGGEVTMVPAKTMNSVSC